MSGRMITLIGADGAGKTTLARRLCAVAGVPVKYIYMGSNPGDATQVLPTTRAWYGLKRALGGESYHTGPPAAPPERRAPSNPVVRGLEHLKSLASLIRHVGDDTYRLCRAEVLRRLGFLVILDRHPFPDYYARRIAPGPGWRRMGDRIHGFLLERVYPRPRGPIFLDAPPDVLYARKPEGSPAAVEARHREYLDVVRVLPDVTVVDAARGEEEVLAELLELVHRGAAPGDAAGGSWARHEDDGSSPPALGQEG